MAGDDDRHAERCLTTKEFAIRFCITQDAVGELIRMGELRAIDVARGKLKPRWRIPPEAITEFETRRSSRRPVQRATRPRRPAMNVPEYV